MRDAAGELAHGLQLLRLPQILFHALALDRLGEQAGVRLGEFGRPRGDLGLQRGAGLAQPLGLGFQLGMKRDDAAVGLNEFPVEALRFLLTLGKLGQAAQEFAVLVAQGDQGFLHPGAGDILGQGGEPLARECLAAVGKPLPEGHDGALARRRLDLEAVHQPAGAGNADAEPGRRAVTSAEDLIEVGDAGPPVDHADHQGLAA